jgi:hypothetical protein
MPVDENHRYPYPATSMTDGRTLICYECGNYEWWADFFDVDLEPQEKWPITWGHWEPEAE